MGAWGTLPLENDTILNSLKSDNCKKLIESISKYLNTDRAYTSSFYHVGAIIADTFGNYNINKKKREMILICGAVRDDDTSAK